MQNGSKNLVVMITRGTDHELSSVGFTIANGGLTAGLDVAIFSPARASISCAAAA